MLLRGGFGITEMVLITGGFGYLGGRLAQYLDLNGYNEIFLGSRTEKKSPAWLSNAKVVRTQWDSSANLEKICAGVDVIVHMAGMNAQDCADNPVAAIDFNGVCTSRLLNAAVMQGVKRFVYLSTAHVYNAPLSGEITENSCPANLHPYATSHRAGEDVVREAAEKGEIEGVVIRLSNAFGTPAHKEANCWNLLMNNLCYQSVASRKMVLQSTGVQRRNFITIANVCRAISHLMELPRDKLENGVFNVGDKTMRVIDMAEMVQSRCVEVLGYAPEIVHLDHLQDEESVELDYRIDKLLSSGFSLSPSFSHEIDATLKMCREEFGEHI